MTQPPPGWQPPGPGPQQPDPRYRDPRIGHPPHPVAQPSPKRRWPWVVGGLAALLVVALVAGLALGGGRSGPQATVEKFMAALADGDAAAALALATPIEGSAEQKRFLSDEALQASIKAGGAITDVEVLDANQNSVQVRASIGGTPSTGRIGVEETDDGWRVEAPMAKASFVDWVAAVGLTINGVKVGAESVWLFPGTYVLASDVDYLDLGDESALTETVPLSASGGQPVFGSENPTLSAAGEKKFRELVAESVASCLKSTEVAPKNCPNQIEPNSDKVSKVRWSNGAGNAEDIASRMVVQASKQKYLISYNYISLTFVIEAECTSGSRTGPCRSEVGAAGKAVLDLRKDPLAIQWQGATG